MVPGLNAVEINQKWSLVYDEDIAHAVEQAQETPMSEIVILYKAASILRKYTLGCKQKFDGSFANVNEAEATPEMLRLFISTLLDGSGFDKPAINKAKTMIVETLAQQIVFHTVGRRSNGAHVRHIKARETPVSIYFGIKLYLETQCCPYRHLSQTWTLYIL